MLILFILYLFSLLMSEFSKSCKFLIHKRCRFWPWLPWSTRFVLGIKDILGFWLILYLNTETMYWSKFTMINMLMWRTISRMPELSADVHNPLLLLEQKVTSSGPLQLEVSWVPMSRWGCVPLFLNFTCGSKTTAINYWLVLKRF